MGLDEGADGGVGRIGVDADERAGKGGGHRQLAGVAVGDLEGGKDASALAVGPADHAAHRSDPSQQGAGDQAGQHRQGVRDWVRSARVGHRPDGLEQRGRQSGKHNSSPTRLSYLAS
ncbi:hypothetical protein ATKI12_8853 [Kitasatospora sp. Ki12]